MKSDLKTSRLASTLIGVLCVAVCVLSCGQERRATSSGRGANNAGNSDAKKPDVGNGGSDASKDNKNLTWNLSCQALTLPDVQTIDDAIVGGGIFKTTGANSYGITFDGNHCDGANPKKDILFLFDSSSAMSAQDPLVNGSCERLEMARAFVKSFSGIAGNRFALIAFSGASQNAVLSSGRFYDSEQGLMGGLDFALSGQTLAEAVCDSTDVGINYDAGLTAAESLIKVSGAADAGTVIIFVTADRPLFSQTGEATAVRLRSSGTLITTLMVGGQEQVLRDRIASVDRNGDPLHAKITNPADLLDAVSDVASRIVIPDVLRYRAVGSDSWTAINLFPLPTGLAWSLPRMEFPALSWPNGVEVEHLHFLPDGTGKGVTKGTLTFQN